LSTKPKLMERATRVLGDMDINAATAGFKNFGQFIAAVNVSQNLGIDFVELRAAMTGTTLKGTSTGEPTVSLGQAIQKLKTGVDGDAEALRAETAANAEISASR
jgi:hypothetical protein